MATPANSSSSYRSDESVGPSGTDDSINRDPSVYEQPALHDDSIIHFGGSGGSNQHAMLGDSTSTDVSVGAKTTAHTALLAQLVKCHLSASTAKQDRIQAVT